MMDLLRDPARRRAFIELTRLHKPIGIFLLLWPTLWALWFAADGWPRIDVLVIFVAGTVVMRMAGCAINDFADRKVDGEVERTRERPLATGAISAREALIVFAMLLAVALGLVLLTNRQTILMAIGGAALTAIYPFMKRYTHLPQVVLGMAFSWGIPMAWTAQTGGVTAITWLLFVATVLLTMAYDTMYAMVDRRDDLRAGIRSLAILLGDLDRVAIGLMQTLMLLALVLAGRQQEFGLFYLAGVGVAALLCLYQQWLIRDREPAACFRAFLNNNWLGLAVFAGVVLETSLR